MESKALEALGILKPKRVLSVRKFLPLAGGILGALIIGWLIYALVGMSGSEWSDTDEQDERGSERDILCERARNFR